MITHNLAFGDDVVQDLTLSRSKFWVVCTDVRHLRFCYFYLSSLNLSLVHVRPLTEQRPILRDHLFYVVFGTGSLLSVLEGLVKEKRDPVSLIYLSAWSRYLSNLILARGRHAVVLRLLDGLIAKGFTVA